MIEDDDLIPRSLILVCDRCGRQYVRAGGTESLCYWCDDEPVND